MGVLSYAIDIAVGHNFFPANKGEKKQPNGKNWEAGAGLARAGKASGGSERRGNIMVVSPCSPQRGARLLGLTHSCPASVTDAK